jgi:hypothetical protein
MNGSGMQRATYRSSLAASSAAILALLAVTVVRTPAAQQVKPLNEQEVIELLEGGVPSGRVSEIVDDRGIDFEFTSDIEHKVRDAGGADDVIAALRQASQRRAESQRPRTGGLVIKTTPGESQIYLNDELQGMTSPEGEIRLPDLQPGTYTLRVSLLGYQSYEKPMTVTAGEEQTVYVTLMQKSPVMTPKDNPAPSEPLPPVAALSTGIPVPGAKVSAVQFYEGPHDLIVQKAQRVYRQSFDRSTTRSIYWELDLSFPPPGRRIDFPVDAIWYRSDGTPMTRQIISAYVLPLWPSSYHTVGYGYAEPGHWTPGAYRVDLYFKNVRIASGTFQIE